ncbi:MAG TPA: DUF983 domain-containing protein [Terriglobales bacterium]|nr:DUF983 domain-containing protein [Terriglobales bacterium]
MHRPSTVAGILRSLCPRCRVGKIFNKPLLAFPKMYPRCAVCDLKFEREEGYFLGAMYISYGVALFTITLIALLLWLGMRWSFEKVVIWAVVFFLPLAPLVTFFSRVLWIYLDQTVDPEP